MPKIVEDEDAAEAVEDAEPLAELEEPDDVGVAAELLEEKEAWPLEEKGKEALLLLVESSMWARRTVLALAVAEQTPRARADQGRRRERMLS